MNELLTVTQVMDYLKVCRATVQRWCKAGELPAVKIGKEYRIRQSDLNAWYDTRGYENADKCAWTFGTTYTANGALANMKLGTRDFLIQQNWVNLSGGYCAKSY